MRKLLTTALIAITLALSATLSYANGLTGAEFCDAVIGILTAAIIFAGVYIFVRYLVPHDETKDRR